MTIREEYNKAYRNYLRRFNNQLQQGFDIPKIERVKRPTRASINRLNRQTAPVLRSSAQRIFDFSEGISYRTKGLKRRYIEEIVKSNREYRADYPEYFKKTPDYSRFDKRPDKINLIISNWMQTIRKLNEPVDEHIAPFFLYQVSTRVLTSDINKIKLAWVIQTYPDATPRFQYYNERIINGVVDTIMEKMEEFDQEDYEYFMGFLDYTEMV